MFVDCSDCGFNLAKCPKKGTGIRSAIEEHPEEEVFCLIRNRKPKNFIRRLCFYGREIVDYVSAETRLELHRKSKATFYSSVAFILSIASLVISIVLGT